MPENPLADIVQWIGDHAAPARYGKGEWVTGGDKEVPEAR